MVSNIMVSFLVWVAYCKHVILKQIGTTILCFYLEHSVQYYLYNPR